MDTLSFFKLQKKPAILLANLHPANQATVNRVDMLDHPIEQKLSSQIPDHLMNSDHYSSRLIHLKVHGIDMRIDQTPLPRPVCSDSRVAVDDSAFHAVRPLDVRLHRRQRAINVAGVECCVRFLEQLCVE